MEMIDKFIHENWVNTLIAGAIILVVTALASSIARVLMKRFLARSTLLPMNSVFVNLIRFLVWLVGIGTLLSVCFKINVNGILTALGVGGIAISLGMQSTVSNLIGGLTVSVTRLVEPGENIYLPSNSLTGVVRDVTWRHTTIDTVAGTTVVIPNSIINTTAIVKKAPPTSISIPIVVTSEKDRLTAIAHQVEDAVEKSVSRVSKLKKSPSVSFSSIGEYGFSGYIAFTIADDERITSAIDAAIRAAAPFVHSHAAIKIAQALEQTMEDQTRAIKESNPKAACADPAEPADPVDPVDSTGPSEPADSAVTVASADPADPVDPVEPASPVDSTDPAGRADPAAAAATASESPSES